MQYYIAQQTLESMEYFDAQDSIERTERRAAFIALGVSFQESINGIINSPNGQNKTLATSIKTWHTNTFEPLLTTPSTGLFDIMDAIESQDLIVEQKAEEIYQGLDIVEPSVRAESAAGIKSVNCHYFCSCCFGDNNGDPYCKRHY
ncbi:MAG: hypothetical protein ACXABO_19675 [Promethearchaeota archaeon]